MPKDPERIPPWALSAVARCDSQTVLIAGAGCSKDEPTSLPLARECAQQGYQQLVNDGVLADDGSVDATDLTAVADAAFKVTGSNEALVARLQPNRFAHASPNEGHMLAIALVAEGAIHDIVTLNYDLAFSTAIAVLRVNNDSIASILGPKHHGRIGISNVIYLHGSAYDDYKDWILTTKQLEDSWKGGWEEVIANRITPSPVVLFAGIGSTAGVLRSTIERVRSALTEEQNRICFENPSTLKECPFAEQLNLDGENHVQLGWIPFVRGLAQRVKMEQLAPLVEQVRKFLHEYNQDDQTQRIQELLLQFDLVTLGQFRAAALLDSAGYRTANDTDRALIALLFAALAVVSNRLDASLTIEARSTFQLAIPDGAKIRVVLASGKGIRRFEAVLTDIKARMHPNAGDTTLVLIGSSIGERPTEQIWPDSVVDDDQPGNVVTGATPFLAIDCSEVLEGAAVLMELIG